MGNLKLITFVLPHFSCGFIKRNLSKLPHIPFSVTLLSLGRKQLHASVPTEDWAYTKYHSTKVKFISSRASSSPGSHACPTVFSPISFFLAVIPAVHSQTSFNISVYLFVHHSVRFLIDFDLITSTKSFSFEELQPVNIRVGFFLLLL